METKKSLDDEYENFELVRDKSSYLIKFKDNLFEVERSDWDSKILGVNFYRLNKIELKTKEDDETIKKFIQFIRLRITNIDCITYKVEATNFSLIENLQKNGFILVGVPIKLSFNIVYFPIGLHFITGQFFVNPRLGGNDVGKCSLTNCFQNNRNIINRFSVL